MGRQIGIVGNFTSRGRLISQPFAEVMTLFALKPWRLSCRVITSHNPRLLFLIAPSWRSIAINLVNSIRLLITLKSLSLLPHRLVRALARFTPDFLGYEGVWRTERIILSSSSVGGRLSLALLHLHCLWRVISTLPPIFDLVRS